MTLIIMHLEERIVLDGAAVDTVIDTISPQEDAAPAPNEEQQGQEPAQQDQPTEQEEAALATDSAAESQGQEVNVLVISSDVNNSDTLASSTREGVITITYNAKTDSLDDILASIRNSLNGAKADSIGFASHSAGLGGFMLNRGNMVSDTVLASGGEVAEFWTEIGELIDEGGRIDLLACSLSDTEEGQRTLNGIEILSGRNAAASDDITANPESGGDWILESDEIDAGAVYFDQNQLSEFVGNLSSNLIINGDFENGFTGFTSDYEKVVCNSSKTDSELSDQGKYSVVESADYAHSSWINAPDHSISGTNYFVANGSSSVLNDVWQTSAPIAVTQANTAYRFEGWIMSLFNQNGPQLKFQIGDGSNWVDLGTTSAFSDPPGAGEWEHTYTDIQFASTGNYYIRLLNNNSGEDGNDLGLDDLYFGLRTAAPSVGTIPGVAPTMVDISSLNSSPEATNMTQTHTYTEGASSVALSQIEVTDSDAGEILTASLTLDTPAAGTLSAGSANGESYTAGTGLWTITGSAAQVNAALAAVSFIPATENDQNVTITTHVQDDSAAGPSNGSITLNVTAVNDQTLATNLIQTQSYSEGDASVALDNIVVSDADTGEQITATLTLADISAGALSADSGNGETYTTGTGVWTISGTVTEVNAALAAVSFTPATDNDVNTSVAVDIRDGLEDSTVVQTGTISLNVTATDNDQPSATNLNQIQGYSEGAASVALDNIVVSDADTGEQITATLTLADISAGALSADSGNGEAYTSGTGVWTISGTVTEVNAALAAVAFTPAGNTDADTTVAVEIKDGLEDGSTALIGNINLNVTSTSNDEPSATNLTKTVNYDEGASSVALDDIVVTDPDSGEQITATLSLANTATGILSADSGNGELYDSTSGIWTITASVADVNAALAAVSFTPVASNDVDTTIEVSIKDGLEDGSTEQIGTITLDCTPAPEPSATPETATEDAVPVITDQAKAEAQTPDQQPPSMDDGPADGYGPESEFNGENNNFGDSAAGEFDGPGRALADLSQVLNALGGGPAMDNFNGPGGADADLSQVVRALQVAPSSLGGGFGGQVDPLGINTGLQLATAESGVQQGSPATDNAAQQQGQTQQSSGNEGQQGAAANSGRLDTQVSAFANSPILQSSLTQLNVEVEGLRFNSQKADFSVTSLEKAVNQLSQLAEETQGQRDSRTDNMLSDMAVELAEICEKAASNGEDVGELMTKLDNALQNLAR